ncbi:hypothetical protein EKE94_16300 [Mesobaculum littorinae]|uniref:Uncharacterized protein n=1 Tax=Mesobaculum littorinae TaxID=2486419 RepID=A0A438AE79_9RHOB|nr:hypothetical protein EKE94_16300 [Mesobaculum littorinae]
MKQGEAARRYFAKFDAIFAHLPRVAAEMRRDGGFDRLEIDVLSGYLSRLERTFAALGMKYLMTGRTGPQALTIDVEESGFPVYPELLSLANDAAQATRQLQTTPDRDALIETMLREILGELQVPRRTQYALSQRLYRELIAGGDLFWPQIEPDALWLSETGQRRSYLVHWAAYDSQINLPVVYLLNVEDTGQAALPVGDIWPEVQDHLKAQSVAGLKLLTIARGLDADFEQLHPKRLRRLHLGPLYSSAYTRQTGPIHDVLSTAAAPEGQDWCLSWTLEELESERAVEERKGWFGTVERQVFALDPFSGQGPDTGATRTTRAAILPERPFQVLAEMDPPGFRKVTKYVVSPGGRVLTYR